MDDIKRPYRSPRREQQARATKQVILDAAHRLFVEHGYNGTSIRAVAQSASVSDQTVYNAFRDKAGLLWALALRIVAGDADNTDPASTPLLVQLRAESDPIARIHLVARASRETWESGMLDLEAMVFSPELRDPRLEELRIRGWEHKLANTTAAVGLLFPDDIRRSGCELADIVDTTMAIDSAATVTILIRDRGWSYDKYEAWLADFMITQYLDPTVATRDRPSPRSGADGRRDR